MKVQHLYLILVLLWGLQVPVFSEYQISPFERPSCEKNELQYGMCFAKNLRKAAAVHHSVQFQDTFNSVTQKAMNYLNTLSPAPSKVVVTDLDETLVDMTGYYEKYGQWTPDTWIKWNQQKHPHIYNKAVLNLLKYAKQKGFSVMFITGRPNKQSMDTLKQVAAIEWDGHFLKPVGDKMKVKSQRYKTEAREMLRKLGYDIVLQIADQPSDFDEGSIEESQGEFLLPNVMYTLY